jgi:hypothetical protein
MRNPWLCLAIVIILGLMAILGVGSITLLTLYERPVPESLVALTSTACGALASFLVQPPRGSHGISKPGEVVTGPPISGYVMVAPAAPSAGAAAQGGGPA